MNHKQKLLEIYSSSFSVEDITGISIEYKSFLNTIGGNISTQKGVFTVLVTLIVHKTLFPNQDIRKHQSNMQDGFSGRSVDTQFITPTLKELGLSSMAESGWLTRSLEQPFPYTLDYGGKISNKLVKEAFLNLVDFVEREPHKAENTLRIILNFAIQAREKSIIPITPLLNPENLTITKLISALEKHFSFNYKTHGGSKLPVLAFYAVYQSIIREIKRYEGCTLGVLGSHTASDRTSKTAGDIQIFRDKNLFEAIEIKLDKEIDCSIVRIAIEKIQKYNPSRYYILSLKNIKSEDKLVIEELVIETKTKHGCQIIVNGVIPSLKYYLRLLFNLTDFFDAYSSFIESDKELQDVHKIKWNELIPEILDI
jgi:DNA (cytosine-5)-methyltransferase 1